MVGGEVASPPWLAGDSWAEAEEKRAANQGAIDGEVATQRLRPQEGNAVANRGAKVGEGVSL